MSQKMKKMLAFTLLCVTLLLLSAGALAEVTVKDVVKKQTKSDLIVDFVYPVFSSSDAALADALNAAISQPYAEIYEAAIADQQARAADRSEREINMYKQDNFQDELRCNYGVIANNDAVVQVLVSHCDWLAGIIRNPWKATAYCFDIEQKRLLKPAELFEGDEQAVYAALSAGAQIVLDQVEGTYGNLTIFIDENSSFVYAGGVMSFVFNPYVLGDEFIELAVPIEGLGLTLKPAYAGL